MPKFPEVDAMTEAQRANNNSAQQTLVRGKYYLFDPPVTATGFPVGGPGVCEESQLEFDRGCYMGMRDKKHVFQGKPANDPRDIPDELRACYFHMLFVGGSNVSLDDDQNHN